MKLSLALVSFQMAAVASEYLSEHKVMEDHTQKENYESPLPKDYINLDELPESFSWGDVDGVSYLTHSLNQHVPQYCGSCWAHGALSALADRIKIFRKAKGNDINLSIQYILNCASRMAGSCHGGTATGTYQFIHRKGSIPYDTCQPYIACSSESKEGFCAHVDTTCKAENICKTCDTFAGNGGACVGIDHFPNASIAEYGTYGVHNSVEEVMAEIYMRGPVAASINAEPILSYHGGIVEDHKLFHKLVNHIVSIVGWGTTDEGLKYWIIRNSWGQYWGEMGFVKLEMGKNALGIESDIAWATPKHITVENFPCDEDGGNCKSSDFTDEKGNKIYNSILYKDPSELHHNQKNVEMMKEQQTNLRIKA